MPVPLSRALPLAALPLAALLLAVGGCDSDDAPVTFQGVEVEARGDATIAASDGALVVSGLGGGRSGGFTVAGQPDRVDVEVDALAIPAGGRFGVVVEDASGAEVASFYNEATSDDAFDLVFDFPGAVTAAVVRYRLGGEVVFEGRLALALLRAGARRAPTSAGSGEGDTGSTHVIRENGRYIVVSDSDGEGGRRAGGCAGFVVTPPAALRVEGITTVCADWVEVEPVAAGAMPRGQVSVVARGVGSFTVRDLEVTATASGEN